MTDSRPLQQQTLLEQLADVLENQSDGDAGSLELRELVANLRLPGMMQSETKAA